MRYFMSYVQECRPVGIDHVDVMIGNTIVDDDHPVAVILDWQARYGEQKIPGGPVMANTTYALLSWSEVGPDVPDIDTLVTL